MAFHKSLSDSKSARVSRTLLSILAIVDRMVLFQLISSSSSPIFKPLGTGRGALITVGIIVTCMSHSFFFSYFSGNVEVFAPLLRFFIFTLVH